MNNRLYFGLSVGTIILLSLMVIMGSIQLIEDTRNYGLSYEVITIKNGVETVTTMTVWVNVGFLGFLSLVIYLLALPIPSMITLDQIRKELEEARKEREEN